MPTDSHPPVRERIPFSEARDEGLADDLYRVHAKGTTEFRMAEIAIEPVDEPSIPEPEWLRLEVVGYHYGDSKPAPTDYEVAIEVTLPPGAKGFEVIGKNRTERLPVIFD